MKKIILLGIFSVLMSCDDGDLQIETLEFDSIDPQTCEPIDVESSEDIVFFKINADEALILELPASALAHVVATTESEVTVGGTTAVTYRIFDDSVTEDYFCSQVPLGTPLVVQEIQAESGMVIITTDSVDTTTFSHIIQLSGISLITSANTRITDLSIDAFGVINTTISEE